MRSRAQAGLPENVRTALEIGKKVLRIKGIGNYRFPSAYPTTCRALAMIHYVPLPHLPANFRVPEKFQNRFWYDEDKKSLAWEGPMFKLSFDRLREISHDYDYQRALEKLFQLSVPEEPAPRGHSRALAIVGGCVLVLAAAVIGVWVLRH